ncbi:WD40 repeat-like protein [Rhizophagus irregularis]|uniref:WD40 repeat-like protein n=1 Tax=Rhizophagus irregularis TaxID=588596 RepID=A0A2N1NJ28_9GLOM|nr:WD40 repeat-like protein [Rhizophagus irregularis]
MPKSKKTRLSNSITKQENKLKKKEKIDQKAISKQPTTKSDFKLNNKLQIKEQTNELISLDTEDKIIVKDFLIIAGSYERILYGIDAHWIKSGESSDDDDFSLKLDPIFVFSAHTGCIKTVSVGGKFLASGSTDEVIKLYNLRKRKELGSLLQHEGSITTIQFFNKTHMFSGSEDGTICIWRTKDWECLKTLIGHKGRVNSLAVHPSGKIALSVSNDKTVRLWNLLAGQKASVNKLGREGEIILWNSSGEQYAILMAREIEIYSTSDAQILQRFQSGNSRFLCMQYYEHEHLGDLLIVGSEDKAIRVYEVKSGNCLITLLGHKNRIKDISIIQSIPPNNSAPFTLLSSISSDGVINVWNLNKVLPHNYKEGNNPIFNLPLATYDTKSRLTCVVLSQKFDAQDLEERASQQDFA